MNTRNLTTESYPYHAPMRDDGIVRTGKEKRNIRRAAEGKAARSFSQRIRMSASKILN